jgi:hypothetical protein
MIYVTHDISEALAIADVIVKSFREGSTEAGSKGLATTKSAKNRPSTRKPPGSAA